MYVYVVKVAVVAAEGVQRVDVDNVAHAWPTCMCCPRHEARGVGRVDLNRHGKAVSNVVGNRGGAMHR